MFFSLPPFVVFLLRKALPRGSKSGHELPRAYLLPVGQYLCKVPEVPGRILRGLAALTSPSSCTVEAGSSQPLEAWK